MFGLSPKQLKAGIAVVLLATVVWATATLLRVSALLILLNVGFEYILGWLTGWAISKTPKAFRWTIERIEVRINYAAEFGFSSETAVSEVIINGWTWHNPVGFKPGGELLYIDRLSLRLSLASLLPAIRKTGALDVGLMLIEGVRFQATRSNEGVLNLWSALDLPEQDVNVIVASARARTPMPSAVQGHATGPLKPSPMRRRSSIAGGLSAKGAKLKATMRRRSSVLKGHLTYAQRHQVQALPTIATAATREAAYYAQARGKALDKNSRGLDPITGRPYVAKFHAKYFRSLRKAFASWFGWHHLMSTAPPPTLPSRSAEQGADLGYLADPHLNGSQQQQRRARAETAIGDPRRRPRWGVPIRFNVQSLIVQDISLRIVDLLMMDRHTTTESNTVLTIDRIFADRTRLEQGDERRSGSEDFRGIFLGELVWVIIGDAIKRVLSKSPSRLFYTAALAAAFALKDTATASVASALEAAVNTPMEASYFAKSYWGGNSSQNQHLANGGGRNSKLFHSVFTTKSRGAECGDISSSSSIISSGGAPNNGNFTGGSAPCMLVARLIRGAGMTRDGSAINVFVQLELYDPPMTPPGFEDDPYSAGDIRRAVQVDKQVSTVRLWTKRPNWNHAFELGPVASARSVLRLVCYHCEGVLGHEKHTFGGEVRVVLSELDFSSFKEVVGYFPIDGSHADAHITGELKLGFQLRGAMPSDVIEDTSLVVTGSVHDLVSQDSSIERAAARERSQQALRCLELPHEELKASRK